MKLTSYYYILLNISRDFEIHCILFQIFYKIFRVFFIFSYECVHSFVTFVGYDYIKLMGTRNCVSQAYGCGSVAQLYYKESEGPVLAGPSAIKRSKRMGFRAKTLIFFVEFADILWSFYGYSSII